MKTKPIPEGHHTVTPYLIVKNGVKALDFYKKAFKATEESRMMMPDGRLGYAEIRVGDSMIMLCDEFPEFGTKAPSTLGGSPVPLYLYVDDVDAFFKAAVAEGAKELKPVEDQFYGDRAGQLQDSSGHTWWVATHTEDVSEDEMKKRAEKAFSKTNA